MGWRLDTFFQGTYLGVAGVENGHTWLFIGEKCQEGEGETGGGQVGCRVSGSRTGYRSSKSLLAFHWTSLSTFMLSRKSILAIVLVWTFLRPKSAWVLVRMFLLRGLVIRLSRVCWKGSFQRRWTNLACHICWWGEAWGMEDQVVGRDMKGREWHQRRSEVETVLVFFKDFGGSF